MVHEVVQGSDGPETDADDGDTKHRHIMATWLQRIAVLTEIML